MIEKLQSNNDHHDGKWSMWGGVCSLGSIKIMKLFVKHGMPLNQCFSLNHNDNMKDLDDNKEDEDKNEDKFQLKQGCVINMVADNHNIAHDMVKLLTKYNFDFRKVVSNNNDVARSCYLDLCSNGNVVLLKYLVDSFPSTIRKIKQTANQDGNNGLHLAMLNHHYETVKLLLKFVYFPNKNLNNKRGIIALNAENKSQRTPAVNVCAQPPSESHRSLQMFKLLVKYNCKLVPLKKNACFPLYAASYYNNVAVLRYIIQNKDLSTVCSQTINKSGDSTYKSTPLMAAIAMDNIEAVQILCSYNGTDIDGVKSIFGKKYTALDYGAYFGNSRILKILLRTLLKQNNISNWKSFKNAKIVKKIQRLRLVANDGVTANDNDKKWKSKSDYCVILIDELINNGIKTRDYNYICVCLRYNVKNMIDNLSNQTVMVEYGVGNNPKINNLNENNIVSRWKMGEILGRGTFGNVLKGTDIYNNEKVALKFISVNDLSKNNIKKRKQITSFIINELDTLEMINHENVVKLVAYNLNVDNQGTMLLVFELAIYGELYQFLSINKYFNHEIAKTYFEQILNALETCHSIGIIHRDIKPQNILVDSKYQAKIADFGLSTYDHDIQNKNQLFVGTRGYMSPEIAAPNIDFDWNDNIIYRDITSSCDLFSLGVILWQLLNGIESMPFDQATENDSKYVFIRNDQHKLFWKCHYNCRIVAKSPNNKMYCCVQGLLIDMFQFNPTKRIKINDIRNHEWYQTVSGYNSKEKAKVFRDTMGKIHTLLKNKQKTALGNMSRISKFSYNTNYKSIQMAKTKDNTHFQFADLRYVVLYHI